jgi:diguanylate cyclase (GGDEF)-like protein
MALSTECENQVASLQQELNAARSQLRLYEALIEHFPGGIILTDSNLNVVLCNDYQKQLLDYPPNMFLNRTPTLLELFHFNAMRGEYGPGLPEDLVAAKMKLVEKRIPHVFERSRPDGRVLEIRGTPLPEGGFVSTYSNVTERRRTEEMVAKMATHDELTQLANRYMLRQHYQTLAARSARGEGFAVHCVDLDDFKPINDKHGHAMGDEILKLAAGRISKAVRQADIVARVGGDEFVILQASVSSSHEAAVLATRVLDAISQPYEVGGIELRITASIGVTLSNQYLGALDLESMLAMADGEMYACKRNGKNSVRVPGISNTENPMRALHSAS